MKRDGLALITAVVFALLACLESARAKELMEYRFQTGPSHGEEPNRRIFGGNQANNGQFPFMVYVVLKTSMCTGSLVKHDWVLLAAHCVPKYLKVGWDTYVVGGKANLHPWFDNKARKGGLKINATGFGVTEREVYAYYIHPAYDSSKLVHDIALLELEAPLESPFIKTVPISLKKMRSIMMCTIGGFGQVPGIARNLQLYYVTNMQSGVWPTGCVYRSKKGFVCVTAVRTHGVCVGDSGSPLLCNGKIWGVCSHYSSFEPSCGAAEEIYYTEVYPELNWIMGLSGSPKNSANLKSVVASVGCFWSVGVAVEVLDYFILSKEYIL